LLKGTDPEKDQSYFLHSVSADALAETIFPLGDLHKSEVRQIARDRGLDIYAKKDSTGICFIGERPFREFLSTYLPAHPGPILTADGAHIGQHGGLMYYTLGQRQGLGIGGLNDRGEAPWYVVDKDLDDNALIVDQGDSELLMSSSLVATNATWIGAAPSGLDHGMSCSAKIRYRQSDQGCTVSQNSDDALVVSFDVPQRAVAPGQFVVFYSGERCLGGGVIDHILSRPAADSCPRTAAI
jgi:tRNA-specific 2-thiouridylase